MEQLSHTQSATDLVGDTNANLQEMSSQVEVAVTDSAESLVSKLNTAFASVDGKVVLSKDTDAEAFIGNLNTNFGLAAQGGGDEPVVDDGIAAFNQAKYGTEMDSTISRVNALKANADLIYVISTDLHYDSKSGFECLSDMLSNQKEFVSRTKSGGIPIDAVLCMGDITDGMKEDTTEGDAATKTAYDALRELARPQLEKMKTYSTPLLICPGNHDNNRDSNNGVVMTDTQLEQLYIDGLVGGAGSNVVFNEANHNLDYYIDYPDKSLRVVMLNANPCDADYTRAISPPSGNTWMWSGPTLRWLARMFGQDMNGNSLSDNTNVMPAGYKALVISHIHPMEISSRSFILPASDESEISSRINADNILVHNKDRIWSIVSGHHHADNVMSSYIVSTRLAANKGQSGSLTPYRAVGSIKPPRNTGDYTKDLWDVMLLNQKDRLIDLIRFGGGFDRHIHLEEIECAAGDSAVLTPNQSLLGNGTFEWHVQDTPVFWNNELYNLSGTYTRMQYERVADVDNGVVNVWAKREHYDYDTRNTPAESLVEETQEQGSTIGKRFIVFCQSPTAREYWCIKIVAPQSSAS